MVLNTNGLSKAEKDVRAQGQSFTAIVICTLLVRPSSPVQVRPGPWAMGLLREQPSGTMPADEMELSRSVHVREMMGERHPPPRPSAHRRRLCGPVNWDRPLNREIGTMAMWTGRDRGRDEDSTSDDDGLPVSVPENGDFRYDQENEANDSDQKGDGPRPANDR